MAFRCAYVVVWLTPWLDRLSELSYSCCIIIDFFFPPSPLFFLSVCLLLLRNIWISVSVTKQKIVSLPFSRKLEWVWDLFPFFLALVRIAAAAAVFPDGRSVWIWFYVCIKRCVCIHSLSVLLGGICVPAVMGAAAAAAAATRVDHVMLWDTFTMSELAATHPFKSRCDFM